MEFFRVNVGLYLLLSHTNYFVIESISIALINCKHRPCGMIYM